jgi:hypothetical protein
VVADTVGLRAGGVGGDTPRESYSADVEIFLEMLAEIVDLFQRPEDMDIFYYLADRTELIFPQEERFVCKVETGPALFSERCTSGEVVRTAHFAFDLHRFALFAAKMITLS